MGPLITWAIKEILDSIRSLHVNSFVLNTRQWNWQILHEFLPANVCLAIAEFPLPNQQDDNDCLVWTVSANGLFSFSSALSVVESAGTDTSDRLWSKIWKLKAPERVKSFLWLAAHERLPTNTHCVKCKVIASDMCSRCGEEAESTLHALRDCFYAKAIWAQLVPQGVLSHFMSIPLRDWIVLNLSYNHHSSNKPSWPLIFSVASWLIWRWRTNALFQDAPTHGANSMATIMQMAREFWFTASTLSSSGLMKGRQEDRWIRWIPPIPGYLKLNCDASISPITGNATAAGLLCNANGHWISGIILNLGDKQDWEAELVAIITGLKMAANKGWNHLLIESDASIVI